MYTPTTFHDTLGRTAAGLNRQAKRACSHSHHQTTTEHTIIALSSSAKWPGQEPVTPVPLLLSFLSMSLCTVTEDESTPIHPSVSSVTPQGNTKGTGSPRHGSTRSEQGWSSSSCCNCVAPFDPAQRVVSLAAALESCTYIVAVGKSGGKQAVILREKDVHGPSLCTEDDKTRFTRNILAERVWKPCRKPKVIRRTKVWM